MGRHSGEATAWILFLIGLFLTSDAAQALYGPGGSMAVQVAGG